MRKIIASEFMTIDGVIQNEENDGDGFRYGASFKVTVNVAASAKGSAVSPTTLEAALTL